MLVGSGAGIRIVAGQTGMEPGSVSLVGIMAEVRWLMGTSMEEAKASLDAKAKT